MSFDEAVQTPATTETATPARRFALELRRAPRGPVVGGMPRVSLLPPEMRDAERVKGVRRAAVGALALAVLLTAGGVAAASAVAGASQARLEADTQQTETLSTQVRKFADIQQLQQRIALGDAAVRVGSSTAIDWQQQFALIEADMPSGFAITSITADGETPLAPYAQGTTPLDKPRVATVVITTTTPSILELPVWLRKLRSIPSYADVTPAVTAGQDGAGFSVLLTVHLNQKAFITPVKGAGR